jgi:RHS repeat-associated protein
VVTGASVDVQRDFQLIGPLPFHWRRYYDSSKNQFLGALGWGHTHEYDRALRFDSDGVRYVHPVGQEVGFPPLTEDGETCARMGVTLERVSAQVFVVRQRGEPAMEFAFTGARAVARLARVFRGKHAISFTHGTTGCLERITDSLGRAIRVQTDKDGRILALVLLGSEPKKNRKLLECTYDQAGNLTSCVDPYGHPFSFGFDANNRMVTATDRRGYSFHYAYDKAGRCIRSAGEDGLHEVRLRYLPNERATMVTKADGGQWQYFYNPQSMLTQVVDPYGGVVKYSFDDQGRPVEELDPKGNVTRLCYDASGDLIGKVSPLGRLTPVPDSTAAVRKKERVGTCALEWEHGYLLRREEILPPSCDDPALRKVPFATAKLVQTVSPDQIHAPHKASRPGNGPAERLQRLCHRPVIDQGEYDDFGTLVRELAVDGSSRKRHYDACGNVLRYHDRDCNTRTYEYTSWNLQSRRSDPLGGSVALTYTPSERVATVVDQEGTRSEYAYDLKDRLIRVTRHGQAREEYRYDAADNFIEKLDGQGNRMLVCEFGKNNLRTSRQLASGEKELFKYDEAGRLVEAATDTLKLTFAYDKAGRQIEDTRNGVGIKHKLVRTKLVETKVLDRFTVCYRRPSEESLLITDPTGREHKIRIMEFGLISRTLANGAEEIAQFDFEGRCLFKSVSQPRCFPRTWTRRFGYSKEGDLLRVEDNLNGSVTYTCDPNHRLASARYGEGRVETYRYDRAGNLLEMPGLSDVSIRDGNRLTAASQRGFEYNHRNHVRAETSTRGTTRYEYNARDFLTCIHGPDGKEWRAQYDSLGRRITKSWQGKRVEFFWDNERLAAEIDGDGRLRIYVYADLFAVTPFMFVDYESRDAEAASGRPYYVFGNQIGAPVLVQDQAGSIVWNARVAAYGAVQISAGRDFHMPLRFPGHYFDAETGFHYNRYRYYRQDLGRYMQSDPAGVSGGLNLYAYAINPLSRVDVLGLAAGDCPDQEPEWPEDMEGTYDYDPPRPPRRRPPHDLTAQHMRDGEVLMEIEVRSGGTGRSNLTREEQLESHTERKVIGLLNGQGEVQEGDIVLMRGQYNPCRGGCQPAIRQFVDETGATVFYTSEEDGSVYAFSPYHPPQDESGDPVHQGNVRQEVFDQDGNPADNHRYYDDADGESHRAPLPKDSDNWQHDQTQPYQEEDLPDQVGNRPRGWVDPENPKDPDD